MMEFIHSCMGKMSIKQMTDLQKSSCSVRKRCSVLWGHVKGLLIGERIVVELSWVSDSWPELWEEKGDRGDGSKDKSVASSRERRWRALRMRVSMVYWAFTLAMWTFTIYLFSHFMKCERENFDQLSWLKQEVSKNNNPGKFSDISN